MKILGRKITQESNVFGKKLVYGKVLGSKHSVHNSKQHPSNNEKEQSSDLEKMKHASSAIRDIPRIQPENMITNIKHSGNPAREPWERRKFH